MRASGGSPAGRWWLACLLLGAALAAYSNHFHNDFHFDDGYAVQGNPAIRDPATIPRFFADPKLFSAQPAQQSYRPVTSTSLAIDYWVGGSLDPFFFHLSTFVWLEVLLLLLLLFFQRIMDLADPHPSNVRAAFFAAALFGLHPAGAETVNYIIQRADLYNALGCVAGLWLFSRYPAQRRFGWYLLPVAAAILAKPPALIFPLLLLAYVLLFEAKERAPWGAALRATIPALAVAGACGWLLWRMRVPAWNSVAPSAFLYRLTQPRVALHYFKTFFLPTELNVDPGWRYVAGPWSGEALAGYLFVAGLTAAAMGAWRRRCARPVAFGVLWFLLALLPTSLMSLLDVTNDHRMFFPFVGLALAVTWSLRLALFRLTGGLTVRPVWTWTAVSLGALLLVAAATATRERNRVWLTDESLWRDATVKNPRNGRAWDVYGDSFWRQGDYRTAASLFERAVAADPACPICEADLMHAYVQLGRDEEAQLHLERLVKLSPAIPDPYLAYGDWLRAAGRLAQSGQPLEGAARRFPHSRELRQIVFAYCRERDYSGRNALFRALDSNHDLALSAPEISAAPMALAGHDWGRLRGDPLFDRLDRNRDGGLSADEMQDAERELLALDTDGDGQLEAHEVVPAFVVEAAREMLQAPERFAELLAAADIDGDGRTTLDELVNELFYRADRDKDGTVAAGEWKDFLRAARPGPPAAHR